MDNKTETSLPGSPEPINITIPADLIEMARKYPAIDWNEVMRFAVQGGVK